VHLFFTIFFDTYSEKFGFKSRRTQQKNKQSQLEIYVTEGVKSKNVFEPILLGQNGDLLPVGSKNILIKELNRFPIKRFFITIKSLEEGDQEQS
jgi:hypothetical protein